MPTNTIPKPPDPSVDPAAYLKSVYAVRERSRLVFEKARRNQLHHFRVDMTKFPDTAAYVVSIIKVCGMMESNMNLLTRIRETLLQIINPSLPMGVGSILMLVEDRESLNCSRPGQAMSIEKNQLVD